MVAAASAAARAGRSRRRASTRAPTVCFVSAILLNSVGNNWFREAAPAYYILCAVRPPCAPDSGRRAGVCVCTHKWSQHRGSVDPAPGRACCTPKVAAPSLWDPLRLLIAFRHAGNATRPPSLSQRHLGRRCFGVSATRLDGRQCPLVLPHAPPRDPPRLCGNAVLIR